MKNDYNMTIPENYAEIVASANTTHFWGDNWEYWDDLYKAIDEIGAKCKRKHIYICGKEKFGTYREEMFSWWNGGLYELIWGYRSFKCSYVSYKRKWQKNCANKIHCIVSNIDEKFWIPFNRKFHIDRLIYKCAMRNYNKIFQSVCKKYPHIIPELSTDLAHYEAIIPGKYGTLDGILLLIAHWGIPEYTENYIYKAHCEQYVPELQLIEDGIKLGISETKKYMNEDKSRFIKYIAFLYEKSVGSNNDSKTLHRMRLITDMLIKKYTQENE